MRAVVMYSGGLASFFAARRAIAKYGVEGTTLLFADTKTEDEDLYRFLDDTEVLLGLPITRIAEGRTVWEVFRDVRFIGNTRADPCSRILKREPMRSWLNENCDPLTTVVVLGFDWTETLRIERSKKFWAPWTVWNPLDGPPYLYPTDLQARCRRLGVEPPRLYAQGFAHNNCGGFCIKAGLASFKTLLQQNPCRYLQHESEEESLRKYLGKDVSILRDRRGGTTKPMTLRAFRERIEAEGDDWVDPFDIGGCACLEEPE